MRTSIRVLAAWCVLAMSLAAVSAVTRHERSDRAPLLTAEPPQDEDQAPPTVPARPAVAPTAVAAPAKIEPPAPDPSPTTHATPPPAPAPPPPAPPPPPPALAAGTVTLDRPGTWVVAVDGTAARYLTAEAETPLRWAGDRLTWSSSEGETSWSVGLDGSVHSFELSDPCPQAATCTGPVPRRFHVLGAAAGRVLVSWARVDPMRHGTTFGLSTFGPDLRDERQIGTYEYAPDAAIRGDGTIALVWRNQLQIVDLTGRTLHGPVELDMMMYLGAWPSWSVSGTHVIVESPSDHVVYTADLAHVRRFGAKGSHHQWSYAPDTSAAAGIHTVGPNVGPGIFIQRDGSLTELVGAGRTPAWHPSGDRIAFGHHLGGSGYGGSVVDVIRPDGSGRATIAQVVPGLLGAPTGWSPDGRWLVVRIPGSDDGDAVPTGGFPTTG